MELHGSSVFIFASLCIGAALGYQDLMKEMTSETFLFNQNQNEAVSTLDDFKMTELTDSIQGLFDTQSVVKQKTNLVLKTVSEISSASFLINQKEAGAGLDDNKMVQLTDSIQDLDPSLFDAKSVALAEKAASNVAAPKVQKEEAAPMEPKPVKSSGKKVIFVQSDTVEKRVHTGAAKVVAPRVRQTQGVLAQPAAVKPVTPTATKAVQKIAKPNAAKPTLKKTARVVATEAFQKAVQATVVPATKKQNTALVAATEAFRKAVQATVVPATKKQTIALVAATEAFRKAVQATVVPATRKQNTALVLATEAFRKAVLATVVPVTKKQNTALVDATEAFRKAVQTTVVPATETHNTALVVATEAFRKAVQSTVVPVTRKQNTALVEATEAFRKAVQSTVVRATKKQNTALVVATEAFRKAVQATVVPATTKQSTALGVATEAFRKAVQATVVPATKKQNTALVVATEAFRKAVQATVVLATKKQQPRVVKVARKTPPTPARTIAKRARDNIALVAAEAFRKAVQATVVPATKKQQPKVMKVARKTPPTAARAVAKRTQEAFRKAVRATQENTALVDATEAVRATLVQAVKLKRQNAEIVGPVVVKPTQLKPVGHAATKASIVKAVVRHSQPKVAVKPTQSIGATVVAKPAKPAQSAVPAAQVQKSAAAITKSKAANKFLDNKMQKTAEEKREESLEQEVAQLKQRLAQASATPAPKPGAQPKRPVTHYEKASKAPAKSVVHDALVTAHALVKIQPLTTPQRTEVSVSAGTQPPTTPHGTWWSPVVQWVSPFFTHIGLAAEATKKKGLTLLSSWGQMAQKDLDKGAVVHSEAQSDSEHAKTLETAQTHTQDELGSHHETDTGADISSYWGDLEQQDGD